MLLVCQRCVDFIFNIFKFWGLSLSQCGYLVSQKETPGWFSCASHNFILLHIVLFSQFYLLNYIFLYGFFLNLPFLFVVFDFLQLFFLVVFLQFLQELNYLGYFLSSSFVTGSTVIYYRKLSAVDTGVMSQDFWQRTFETLIMAIAYLTMGYWHKFLTEDTGN